MLQEKEYFDTWMHRLMDMLERIESNQKPPKMPEYAVLRMAINYWIISICAGCCM